MRLLLDTHALLWWLSDDRLLGRESRQAIEDPAAIVHVSSASIWEISIKVHLGRLEADIEEISQEIPHNRFEELPIRFSHARLAGALPQHHSDPFDRMLIAQAQSERLTVVTRDPVLGRYEVDLLEA